MKNLFLLLAIVTTMMSCQKENITPTIQTTNSEIMSLEFSGQSLQDGVPTTLGTFSGYVTYYDENGQYVERYYSCSSSEYFNGVLQPGSKLTVEKVDWSKPVSIRMEMAVYLGACNSRMGSFMLKKGENIIDIKSTLLYER